MSIQVAPYDKVVVYVDGTPAAKAYVHRGGQVTNLYVRKEFRGTDALARLIAEIRRRHGHLALYGYASPKRGPRHRAALIRLYSMHGARNTHGAMMEL